MKKLLLIVTSFCFCVAAFSQLVSLGTETGAGSTNVLLSTSTTTNKYSKTISIYTATEIIAAGGVTGAFTSLWWKKNGTGEYQFNDAQLRVYIKHTTNSLWASVPNWDAEIVGAKNVFTNTSYSIPTGTGFKQVVFDSSFAWDGTSNIAVFVDWYRPSTPTADITWSRSTTANTNATRVGSSLSGISTLLLNSNRPLLQLQINPALPVNLTSFSALLRNGVAYINWQTQTEQNTNRFEVEVSADGSRFTTCGSIAAAGSTTTPKQYTFTHQSSVTLASDHGYIYYRLKTIDNDGKTSYSKIVKLTLQKGSANISVYPNPVKDVFTLSIAQSSTDKVSYSLSTLDGRKIAYRSNVISGSGVLAVDALATQPSGNYLLEVWIGNEHRLLKINKQ